MKLKNIYLISLALIAGAFAGCTDDTENFDNQLFVTSKTPTAFYVKTTVQDVQNATGEFSLSIPKPSMQDVTFTIKADAGLVSVYEDTYYVSGVEALPEGHYSFSTTEGKIAAGALKSEPIIVSFTDLGSLDFTKTYVLPVTVANASIGVLGSANTYYYVFKGAALINKVANIKKNNVYVDWVKPDVVQNMATLTAEALIRPHSFDHQISTLMGIEGQFLFRFGDNGVEPNQLQIATGKGNFTNESMVAPLNEWTHVAVAYDANAQTLKVYFNGKLVGDFTEVAYGPVNWGIAHSDESDGKPRCFWIGYSYNNDRSIDADISEVRIWNKALTKDEINAENHFYTVSEDSEGLVAYWKFDDGADILRDYSNGGNNATASSALTWVDVELPANK